MRVTTSSKSPLKQLKAASRVVKKKFADKAEAQLTGNMNNQIINPVKCVQYLDNVGFGLFQAGEGFIKKCRCRSEK